MDALDMAKEIAKRTSAIQADMEAILRPAHVLAHTDGPDTAKEAAAANAVRKATNRFDLLVRYNELGPATTEHMWLLTPTMDLSEVRRRATDLLAGGLLERTGKTARTTKGRNAEILRISEDGKRVLANLTREA